MVVFCLLRMPFRLGREFSRASNIPLEVVVDARSIDKQPQVAQHLFARSFPVVTLPEAKQLLDFFQIYSCFSIEGVALKGNFALFALKKSKVAMMILLAFDYVMVAPEKKPSHIRFYNLSFDYRKDG